MGIYPGRDEIEEWIEWTRASLPVEGDIPYLDWTGPEVKKLERDGAVSQSNINEREEPPWNGAITDLLDESTLGSSAARSEGMLDMFVQAMSHSLLDLAPRFTALHFYYSLATDDWPEYSPYKKDQYDPVQSAFRRDLRTLVGMLPADEWLRDWRRIKWEISNALVAKDSDRVRQLFKFAEAFRLVEDAELKALRGQIIFFLAFGQNEVKRPETHFWLLSVNPPDVGLGSPLVLEAYGLSLVRLPSQIFQGTLDRTILDAAREVRYDLENALQSGPNLGPAYHAMLASCYLALEEFARAANEYGVVLETETAFRRFFPLDFFRTVVRKAGNVDIGGLMSRLHSEDFSPFFKDFKPELFQTLAKAHALAGQQEKAQAVLQQWAQEYPNDPQVHLNLAELFAQEPNYKEAYEALRKAVDLKPELERELPYKVAIPLGAIAAEQFDADRLARQAIKAHPELERLLDLLFPDFWPTYGELSSEARGPWLSASALTYYFPLIQPASASQWRQMGSVQFAKAVEIQIRQSVFEPFKEDIVQNQNGRAAAELARRDQRARRFAEFIVGRGKLTLGDMEFILWEARTRKGELFKLFADWMSQHFPQLQIAQLKLLEKIRIPRNLESHESVALDVKDVPKLCCLFLNVLLA
jgi:tetratricopeptide (TPR) repeat protein